MKKLQFILADKAAGIATSQILLSYSTLEPSKL